MPTISSAQNSNFAISSTPTLVSSSAAASSPTAATVVASGSSSSSSVHSACRMTSWAARKSRAQVSLNDGAAFEVSVFSVSVFSVSVFWLSSTAAAAAGEEEAAGASTAAAVAVRMTPESSSKCSKLSSALRTSRREMRWRRMMVPWCSMKDMRWSGLGMAEMKFVDSMEARRAIVQALMLILFRWQAVKEFLCLGLVWWLFGEVW
ncbi:hypothetical protein IWX90DRAFT_495106 [Phyllosticta citrichinensis]|uniref:Uncharacterized protein n=1 Tax=Phyllosticta citrichinensis TaxID=1130410 RepID=A0ABR1XGD5_9PEZI